MILIICVGEKRAKKEEKEEWEIMNYGNERTSYPGKFVIVSKLGEGN